MKKLFGTDGIRATAGKFPLDRETVIRIGKAIARYFGRDIDRKPRFVIGRDTRESGAWIEMAFAAGAASEGAVCESAGVITTPGVAYLTGAEKFDAGIVISASHNPYQDNGVKVFLPSGKKLDGKAEREIEKMIFGMSETAVEEIGVDSSNATDLCEKYLNHLMANFNGLDISGTKIVVDCANGAASGLAPELFSRLGAHVTAINNSPDGTNINKNCGSLHLENLQREVIAGGADLGVAFDGDADRSLFVDEKGGVVDGDATMWIMAQHLQDTGRLVQPLIVATVMSNIGLEVALRTRSIELLRTDVGDKYVLGALLETGAAVGGEQSGHIIFPQNGLVGDGLQTALSLLETQIRSGRSLSALRAGFDQFPQILVNVMVGEKRPFDEVAEIIEKVREVEASLGDTGRLLLRYSGTENLARVMIEGKDQIQIERLANDLADVIKTSLGG
ncbi:MAG: phosphoglucosamine mutase [Pyrinomonadaceae bacterium]